MGRTAKAILYGSSYKIVTDLDDKVKGRSCGDEIWDFLYPIFILDDTDRLVYLEQFDSGPKGIRYDISTIADNPHPSAEEIFDTVDIIDEETGEVLKTLHNVNLLGILEGIKEVMGDGKNVIRDT